MVAVSVCQCIPRAVLVSDSCPSLIRAADTPPLKVHIQNGRPIPRAPRTTLSGPLASGHVDTQSTAQNCLHCHASMALLLPSLVLRPVLGHSFTCFPKRMARSAASRSSAATVWPCGWRGQRARTGCSFERVGGVGTPRWGHIWLELPQWFCWRLWEEHAAWRPVLGPRLDSERLEVGGPAGGSSNAPRTPHRADGVSRAAVGVRRPPPAGLHRAAFCAVPGVPRPFCRHLPFRPRLALFHGSRAHRCPYKAAGVARVTHRRFVLFPLFRPRPVRHHPSPGRNGVLHLNIFLPPFLPASAIFVSPLPPYLLPLSLFLSRFSAVGSCHLFFRV